VPSTRRQEILALLRQQPRSVSSLALAIGARRDDIADDLAHVIRSARSAGERVVVVPSSCKACRFEFGEDRLLKPGKCPSCGASRLHEAQVSIEG